MVAESSRDNSSKRRETHFPVRTVLTIFAVVLVTVISIALIAPYLSRPAWTAA
jgi:hypothetical protein